MTRGLGRIPAIRGTHTQARDEPGSDMRAGRDTSAPGRTGHMAPSHSTWVTSAFMSTTPLGVPDAVQLLADGDARASPARPVPVRGFGGLVQSPS